MPVKITHPPVLVSENVFSQDTVSTPPPVLRGEWIPHFH